MSSGDNYLDTRRTVVAGNPARIVGYTGVERPIARYVTRRASVEVQLDESVVSGVRLLRLRHFEDIRGSLVVTEFSDDLPFFPRRQFFIYRVPSQETRGEHAHRACEQFLVCVHGSVHALADDGLNRQEFVLDTPRIGLHMGPMIWGTQYRYSHDAILMVFASMPYDERDYVRDYDEFLSLVRR